MTFKLIMVNIFIFIIMVGLFIGGMFSLNTQPSSTTYVGKITNVTNPDGSTCSSGLSCIYTVSYLDGSETAKISDVYNANYFIGQTVNIYVDGNNFSFSKPKVSKTVGIILLSFSSLLLLLLLSILLYKNWQ